MLQSDSTHRHGENAMKALSHKLLTLVDTATPALSQVDDSLSKEPVLAGGWSRKQLLGHLIDSASNNHQRFVRASLQESLNFPGYDQNGNVRAQHFQQGAPGEPVELLQPVSGACDCASAGEEVEDDVPHRGGQSGDAGVPGDRLRKSSFAPSEPDGHKRELNRAKLS